MAAGLGAERGVGVDDDDGGPLGVTGLDQGGLQVRDVVHMGRYGPHGSGVPGEIDGRRRLVTGRVQQVVEAGAPGGPLEPVDAAEARLSRTTTVVFNPSMTLVASSEFIIM